MDKPFHKNLFNEVPETFMELLELMDCVYGFYGVESFNQLEESVQRGLMCAIREHAKVTNHKTLDIVRYLDRFNIPIQTQAEICFRNSRSL